jgi:hypothetical protein
VLSTQGSRHLFVKHRYPPACVSECFLTHLEYGTVVCSGRIHLIRPKQTHEEDGAECSASKNRQHHTRLLAKATIHMKERCMDTSTRILAVSLFLSWLFLLPISGDRPFDMAIAQEVPNETQQTNTITGVLKELDVEEQRGTIMTDVGEPVFVVISHPNIVSNIHEGQHVTAEITQESILTNIIETPLPELQTPME